MSVRVFAEYLGVTTGTVSGWEHREAPVLPRLATQALLDQALKLADADARTRFGLVLRALPDGAARASAEDAGGSTVTSLRGRARAGTARV